MNTQNSFDRDISHLLNKDDWPLRWQRRLGLAPRTGGLGIKRRALFFTLLTWLPLAVWAYLQGHALPGTDGEPLLAHYGVNVRCLVAIPLLILAQDMSLKTLVQMAKQFVRNGIVTEAQQGEFMALMHDAARRRDSSLPWVVISSLTIIVVLSSPAALDVHSLSWAVEAGELGFGGWWFAYVARPIFSVLLIGWLWRIMLAFLLFRGIAKLELSLVPSHPDRLAGLGFLEYYPKSYAVLTFVVSAVIASGWAHDAVYHAHDVHTLVKPLIALVIVWSLIVLSPLLVFAPRLIAAKREGEFAYGRVIGEHGRLVRQRWVLNQDVPDEECLEPLGMGNVADANAIYDAVKQMRVIPVSKAMLMSILIPLLIPMLAVFAIQIPIKELLLKVLGSLV